MTASCCSGFEFVQRPRRAAEPTVPVRVGHEGPGHRRRRLHRQEPARSAGARSAARPSTCFGARQRHQRSCRRVLAARRLSSFTWPASTGPTDPAEFDARQRRLHRAACATRCGSGAAGRTPVRVRLVDPGRAATTPTGGASARPRTLLQAHARGDRRAGAHLPAAERLRQVVPPELQLGGRHLLPQHRPRSADHVHRRPDARLSPGATSTTWSTRSCAVLRRRPPRDGTVRTSSRPAYATTVGELAGLIQAFQPVATSLVDASGSAQGFMRALYATYLCYLPTGRASPTECPKHGDPARRASSRC